MDAQPDEIETQPAVEHFDEYVSYEDGDALVVCDRSETTAWVRSDTVVTVDR